MTSNLLLGNNPLAGNPLDPDTMRIQQALAQAQDQRMGMPQTPQLPSEQVGQMQAPGMGGGVTSSPEAPGVQGQLSLKDQAAIDRVRNREAPGMASIRNAKASDPWTALAQIGGAFGASYLNNKRAEKEAGVLTESLQGAADKDAATQLRETERADEEWGLEQEKFALQETIEKRKAEEGRLAAETARLKAEQEQKASWGAYGDYELDGEQVNAVVRNGVLTATSGKNAGQPLEGNYLKVDADGNKRDKDGFEVREVYDPYDATEDGFARRKTVLSDEQGNFKYLNGNPIPAEQAQYMNFVPDGLQSDNRPKAHVNATKADTSLMRFNHEVATEDREKELARLDLQLSSDIKVSTVGKMFSKSKEVWDSSTGILNPKRYIAQYVPALNALGENPYDYLDERVQAHLRTMNQAEVEYLAPVLEILGPKPTDFDAQLALGTVPGADDTAWVHIDYVKNQLAPNVRKEFYRLGLREEGDAAFKAYMGMADEAQGRLYPVDPAKNVLTTEQKSHLETLKKEFEGTG